jgi:hypothetical protein
MNLHVGQSVYGSVLSNTYYYKYIMFLDIIHRPVYI